uniref:Reverse transcriptase domain-containing protein n=1 Tax=Tanacetum cinerariifolium TaxID=118510 RepID=A0A6L2LYK2_TANCI|nr:reverse transcriptase domain-containing protein [Tanacetum cinerariifolium]
MQTRSSSRLVSNPSSNPTSSTNPNPKGCNRRRSKQRIENLNLDDLSPPIVTMADQRTMAQLLQAPTEGYKDAIVIPAITANNFELKHSLLTLVQNKQFFGHDKEDPHAHVRYFNKITSTLKFSNVSNTSIKLMLFPFFFEGAVRIRLEKEPPRSIFTWDDLVSKFINQFFPPSKTTNIHNEITNFQQHFDESFSEAWDRFKDLLRACPRHGFSELHQLDTFYNALNSKYQDSLNSVVGCNFLDKMPCECLAIIESKSKVRYSCNKPVVAKVSTNASTSSVSPDVVELKDMVKALLLDKKSQNQSPAPVKAVEVSCVTCSVNYNQGNTSYHPPMMSNQIRPPGFPPVPNNQNVQRNNQNYFIPNHNRGNNSNQGPVYQPLVFQPPAYQAPVYQAPNPQTQGVSKEDFSGYVKANDAVMRNMKIQGQNMQNQLTNLTDLITKFVNSNSASTSSSGTLPSNTIANPKSDLKAITTRSGVSYDRPQIPPPPSSLPKVVENEPEVTKDIVNPTNNGNTKDVQPQAVQFESPVLISKAVTSPISEPAIAPVSASKPNSKASIPYPSRRNDEKNHEKANNQIEKFYQIFKNMSFEVSFADALILMPKFASTLKALIGNKEKLSEMARTPLNEHFSAVLLKKLPEKLGDPGKFLIPCDFPGMAECLALAYLGASINLMPFSVWKRLSLPDLTPMCMTLELADRSISRPIGVAEDVYVKEVLGFSDTILSGSPTPYYDSIVLATSPTLTPFGNSDFLLEEVDAFLAIKDEPTSSEFHQSYLDPEGDILLLEAFLNDDPSLPPPNQRTYLPKVRKELKICEAKSNKSLVDKPSSVKLKDLPPHLEYAFLEGDDKLSVIISKDLSVEEKTALISVLKSHNLVHCVPKKGGFTVVENEDNELIPTRLMLERLAGNQYYCFLDYFFGYFQIPIDPKDQEKTTFTCPYGTFAYHRMPFGLCNAPGTFQRCMMAIFHDMIEKTMEMFMDDFSVFGNSFQSCLSYLERMLKRCEDTNLCLNWEKIHFMVKEGIVLCHKISKQGIGVDKAKVDVITKLPHPKTVKCIRRFLGHAGFYRRFIKDFSKIASLKLIEAPILIARDWDMPFELMRDASDFTVGAVLGQRQDKHYRPIHYASNTMTEAESNYTTTEKEMLAVEFTFKVIDTKGAENLAADHLSRLENPNQNVLDPKEINESFHLELLNLVSTRGNQSTPWFADFANYHAGNFIVKGMSSPQKSKFFKDVKHYFWDDPYLFKIVLIKSSEGMYLARKPLISSRLTIIDPQEVNMAQITQPKRCLIQDFIGPPYTVMPRTLSKITTFVNVKARFHKGMRFHKTPSKFVKFFMFGVSTLWARFRPQEETNIYSLQSTIC